jgi:hypothetical protein
MSDRTDEGSVATCSPNLVAWARAAYLHAGELYGPGHPLTKSWLHELRDLEFFASHIESQNEPGAQSAGH